MPRPRTAPCLFFYPWLRLSGTKGGALAEKAGSRLDIGHGCTMLSFRGDATASNLRGAIAPRGISRFRVWSFGPSRNDGVRGYAARIFDRNASISSRSTSASRRSALEAVSTSLAAVPASVEAEETPTMLLETSLVPPAACWMLRAIARVAAPFSSTAAAIAVVTSLISLIVEEMLRIADTADVVTVC